MNTNRFATRSSVLLSIVGSLLLLVPQIASAMTGAHAGWGCATCHTPHAGAANNIPLWGFGDQGATGYTLYVGNLPVGVRATTVNASSRACLVCHDGVTRAAPFTGAINLHTAGGVFSTTMNLSDDHPVSITYDATRPQINPTTTLLGTGLPAVSTTLRAATAGGAANQVECATCHDVHGSVTGVVTANLLRTSAVNLCAACHSK